MDAAEGALDGITSACAESTRERAGSGRVRGNHLRLRGEHIWQMPCCSTGSESPPLARRALPTPSPSFSCQGITSACAESTNRSMNAARFARNHLRLRGEHYSDHELAEQPRESPPLARRARVPDSEEPLPLGITSACAESTSARRRVRSHPWNHLRLRGEHVAF